METLSCDISASQSEFSCVSDLDLIDAIEVNAKQDIGVDNGVPPGEVEGVAGVEHVDSALDERDHLKRIAASLNDTHV